jgi:hypothetical protein
MHSSSTIRVRGPVPSTGPEAASPVTGDYFSLFAVSSGVKEWFESTNPPTVWRLPDHQHPRSACLRFSGTGVIRAALSPGPASVLGAVVAAKRVDRRFASICCRASLPPTGCPAIAEQASPCGKWIHADDGEAFVLILPRRMSEIWMSALLVDRAVKRTEFTASGIWKLRAASEIQSQLQPARFANELAAHDVPAAAQSQTDRGTPTVRSPDR